MLTENKFSNSVENLPIYNQKTLLPKVIAHGNSQFSQIFKVRVQGSPLCGVKGLQVYYFKEINPSSTYLRCSRRLFEIFFKIK